MRIEEATAVANLISFSLFGFNREEQVCIPGTGFRIAPGLGLTAKHVSDELFRTLAIPEGTRIPRRLTRYEGVEIRALQQEIGTLNTEYGNPAFVRPCFRSLAKKHPPVLDGS